MVAGLVIIVATIILIVRSYRRHAPQQPYDSSVVSDYGFFWTGVGILLSLRKLVEIVSQSRDESTELNADANNSFTDALDREFKRYSFGAKRLTDAVTDFTNFLEINRDFLD